MPRALAVGYVLLAVACSADPPGETVPLDETVPPDSVLLDETVPPDSSIARALEGEIDSPGPDEPGEARESREPLIRAESALLDTLRAFYAARDHRPIWREPALEASLREALQGAWSDGLPVERYRTVSDAARTAPAPGSTAAELARRELRASTAFLRVASALARGTIDPSEQGLTWRIERGDHPGRTPLEAVAAGEDPAAVLDRYRPDTPQYERLRTALDRYRAVARRGGWDSVPTPDGSGVLEPGDRSRVVPALRSRLAAEPGPERFDPAEAARAPLESERDTLAAVYDSVLSRRVRTFQRRHGVAVDGVVGPETLAELNRPVEERLVEIVLNLDRLRWLPSELGERYVIVNVAGFEMEVVENDTTAVAMEVVVGEPAWKTPIFADTLSHLVVNPYWNVPRSIAEEEILPAAREDPSYIRENRFQVVDRFGPDVEPIPRGSIDWRSVDPERFPYLLRQAPGAGNSLGRIKFLFPNRFDIYLHDTPADQLFEESSRAFSHGCIRVEDPIRLGRYLFAAGAEARPGELESLVASGERVRVDLTTEVPVYIVYLTAWSEPDGVVHFHDDIYERDAEVEHRAREIVASARARRIGRAPRTRHTSRIRPTPRIRREDP